MELVELLVRMDCSGYEKKVRKQLAKLKGVDSVEIDTRMGKVTVFGYVDPWKVLKAIRKTGKRAEFWQEAFNRLHYSSYPSYTSNADIRSYHSNGSYGYNRPSSYIGTHFLNQHVFKRTYNYEKHGYNHHSYGDNEATPSYAYSSISHHENTPSLFSDENPNACSIM